MIHSKNPLSISKETQLYYQEDKYNPAKDESKLNKKVGNRHEKKYASC